MPVADRISFTTALKLYRPTQPPHLTTRHLAQFITQVTAMGLLADAGPLSAGIQPGPRIDADTRPLQVDSFRSFGSLGELGAFLATEDAPIYRAAISLGRVHSDLSDHISHGKRLLEGEELSLSQFWIEIGPVEALRLVSDDHFLVGWMSLNLSGLGYISPWQLRGFVESATRHPKLQALADLCRRTWPVASGPTAIPRPRYPVPWDWQWGVHEKAKCGA